MELTESSIMFLFSISLSLSLTRLLQKEKENIKLSDYIIKYFEILFICMCDTNLIIAAID